MYFITVHPTGCVNQVFDGSKDGVHRLTGETLPDAVQIPDDAIRISDADFEKIKSTPDSIFLCWDGTSVIDRPAQSRAEKQAIVLDSRKEQVIADERDRLDALPNSELEALYIAIVGA